ncbi:TPA: YggS family pyridoxal phosphate-dependent enzyme [Streptococcus suis]|uniref:YggS family pyridoxal phosphate-dependent enzyme n=1 Tax=Streptococcus TaxID=1301 RepID=UPI00192D355B|nr:MULTISPECIES: YggS family pyridoxal phosphate-dependent enzyme [Streptococcus]MBL6439209.1 YggS family pyridoxal phosphate-dependent enzyme [Streptococcus suis]MBM7135923.1 YggS family pyridoxal phosphate-dependent enzyme [Streptococcus suis]MBY0730982.1 YggS family pyridoxal phosphate-dependent enzyme [Streptococcus sp. 2018162]MCO8177815.1 YggS family pyridoxal phosphate-dependent enzyme [Streptococcus suis]HEM3463628.1 YggS family pyridoxal phosphate-dependent enzyme [Streptococcus suis]
MNFQKNKDAIFSAVAKAAEKTGRPSESVKVIAVTKYVDSSIANQLVNTGITHIGENRVDQFLEKYNALADKQLTWHLIGTLQRRKVKDIIPFVDYFHALDSVKLAQEIDKRATKIVKCFLQVNVSGEESKHGFAVSEIDAALAEISLLENIELVGLMTMAPIDATDDELDEIFSKMQEIQEELATRNLPRMPFTELSMGMSGDFERAIAHGATYVRIGSAFFE